MLPFILSLLVSLFVIVLQPIYSSDCNVPGVHPKECSKYSPSSQFFYCGGDKNKKIPMKYVNDDYCDCVGTGDDEPGTSACNQGRFWCVNIGYRGRYIYSSLVNDGLCDCCDGSDEQNKDIRICPNVCNQKAKSELQSFLEQKKKYQEGIKVKNTLIVIAKSKLNEKQKKKKQIEDEIQQKKNELNLKENIKEKAEKKESEYQEMKDKQEKERQIAEQERCERDGDCPQDDDDGDGDDDNGENLEEIEEETEAERKERTMNEMHQRNELEAEQRRKARRERHQKRREKRRKHRGSIRERAKRVAEDSSSSPDSDGDQKEPVEPVEEIVHSPKEDIVHTPDEEFPYPDQYKPHHEEEPEEIVQAHTPDEEFPYPDEYRPHHDDDNVDVDGEKEKIDDGFDWSEFDDDEDEIYDDVPDPDSDDCDEEEPEEEDPVQKELENAARDARNDVNTLNRKIRDLESDLDDINKALNMDFGYKNIYAALFDECYSTNIGKYDYEFCPFGEAKQKEGHSGTSLGKFKSFEYNDKNELVMLFDDGQKCWNGPKRSVGVIFQCDTENDIISVSEPSTCKYSMTFNTPMACNQEELNRLTDIIQNQFKTEL